MEDALLSGCAAGVLCWAAAFAVASALSAAAGHTPLLFALLLAAERVGAKVTVVWPGMRLARLLELACCCEDVAAALPSAACNCGAFPVRTGALLLAAGALLLLRRATFVRNTGACVPAELLLVAAPDPSCLFFALAAVPS